MCSLLPQVATKTRVVVVMHALEERKSTNTGHLATVTLTNCQQALFGRDRTPFPARPWPEDCVPVILFPVAGAQPVSDFRGTEKLALVALDANWRQANRLRKRFAAQNIPFVTAPAGPSEYQLRNEPHEHGMSTFEAIIRSLAVLEDIDITVLEKTMRIFRDRMLWCRGSIDKADVEGGIPDGILRHELTRAGARATPTPLR